MSLDGFKIFLFLFYENIQWNKFIIIFFLNKGGRKAGEEQRERENLKQALCLVWASTSQPWDHDLNQNEESEA